MDNILWLLYFADVAGALAVILTIFIVFSIFGSVIFTIAASGEAGEFKTVPVRLMVCIGLTALLVAAIPSKSTIYAIAAAKAGDQALHTETGGKAIKALNAWLDRQIAGEEEEPSK